ncbi:MAG: hypothetical protein ABF628_04490, partial [Acetobacter orientalis]|uniref:hypothetical protein n=1 Tax=Acetobacter orientalis TaxID=146474 RepID=UPI0039E7B162
MINIKRSVCKFISEYKINIVLFLIFAFIFFLILHFTLDFCSWGLSFVQAFCLSLTLFIVIPSQAKNAARMIPRLADELIGIISFTTWGSAFWAGWLFYSGQIAVDGEPLSKVAKITKVIFIMETNFSENLIFSAVITIFVILVMATSWGLR